MMAVWMVGGLFLVQEAGGVASDLIADNGLLGPGSALACTPACRRPSSRCATAPPNS